MLEAQLSIRERLSTGSQAKSMLAEPYAETRAKMLAETPTVVAGVGQVFLSQLETDERSLPVRPLVPATAGGLVLFAAQAGVRAQLFGRER